MTGPSHLSNYEAALWWMNTADQIINDTGGEELPAAAVASHAALIRASVYSSLAIADAITSHTNDTPSTPDTFRACPSRWRDHRCMLPLNHDRKHEAPTRETW